MAVRNPRTIILSVAIVASMVLCVPIVLDSEPDEVSRGSSSTSELTIGLMDSIDSLNPYVGLNKASYLFYGLVYDALTSVGNDLEPIPNLAKSCYAVPLSDPEMTGMPFGSIWQYNITQNAHWTDGQPFTADDVVYNVWLNAEPTHYASMWAYQPYAYYMHQAWKVDNYTVRISFWDRDTGNPKAASYAYLLSMPMLPKHLLESYPYYQIGMNWTGVFSDAESPGMPIVGTGPFMATPNIYSEWLAGDHITLVRNPNCHWTSEYGKTVKFDSLVLKFFQDPTSMVLALENKEIDVADYPASAYRYIEDSGWANVTTFDGPRIDGYFNSVEFCLNNAGPNPSRLDPIIRQALHMATNKQHVVDNYYLAEADVGSTLIPPANSYWHYEPIPSEKVNYSLTTAASLLESNGYIDIDSDGIRECTAGSPAVQMGYVPENKKLTYEMLVGKEHPEEKDIAAYLKAEWAQIGVVVNYLVVDEMALWGNVYSYAYDTAILDWSADVDPNYILFAQTKMAWSGWSTSKYYNPVFDDNYTTSVSRLNNSIRQFYVYNCQRTIYKDNAYIVTAYPHQTYAWRTDTFTGWGNWSLDPGRSLDNTWTGNQLLFDLLPEAYNSPPAIDSLGVNPNPVLPGDDCYFTVYAIDDDADAISFYIEFGDGGSASAVGWNTTGPQIADFVHAYSAAGMYNVTVFVNDSYAEENHNVSHTFQGRVLVGPASSFVATISPTSVVLAIEDAELMMASVEWDGYNLTYSEGASFHWTVVPTLNGTLGYFDNPSADQTYFTAGPDWGSGTISCVIDYYEIETVSNASLTVEMPVLDHVTVSPSSWTVGVGVMESFVARAYDTGGRQIPSAMFTWTVEGLSPGQYGLFIDPSTADASFIGYVQGTAWLNASATIGTVTRTGSSLIQVETPGSREVNYRWYDMFNVPFGEWWAKRWEIYKQELPLSYSYPYIFQYFSHPEGNEYYYSNMRLNITGRNMDEVNMSYRPEFLPYLGSERGGNAQIDWYMQYLTLAELMKYGGGIYLQNDGWIIGLNGTATMDEQAAKSVLNVSDAGFDNFPVWWSTNRVTVNQMYADWLVSEAEGRLDIENAYESYFQLFTVNLTAEKIGSSIVLHYDIVTWGMEALMMRWLKDAFMPTEWWYEDMTFHASIGPTMSSFDIDTGVDYAVFADQSYNHTLGVPGESCWRWQAMMGDAVPSTITHPHSDFDPYVDEVYQVHRPGSPLYGYSIQYDYTPGCWNLSANETLEFTYPAGDQQFKYHVAPGLAVNVTGEMRVNYAEPMYSDFPGQVIVNNSANTIVFAGPMDVFDWSRNQSSHWYLDNEWSRLGGNLLPYGQPTVEFGRESPVPLYLDHFDIDVLDPVIAGDLVTVVVTAIDQYGNPYIDYNGSVSFTSTDPLATLPLNYTFQGYEDGTHWFFDETIFRTAGTQNITVTNISTSLPKQQGSRTVLVLPMREASSFEVGVYHLPAINIAEDITVTVHDQYGDVFVNYTGTITFSTNRTGKVTLPADYTFVLGDAGVHTIVGGLTFKDTGWFTITVTDTANSSLSGSQTVIMVLATPEVVDHFIVMGIQDMLTKQRSDVTVIAFNQLDMVFIRYSGTIHFSSNGSGATLPSDYTFQELDVGVANFTDGVSFALAGVYSVIVTDTVVTSAIGSQEGIIIQSLPMSETFRMYDLFQEPWGEWWPWRYTGYKTDIILNNETGKYTMIYNPDTRALQGIIYAPYRWNITGTNITTLDMDHPEFMPVLGPESVPGASANLSVYFQYYDHNWWNNYWKPYWNFDDSKMAAQVLDGYYLGVVYNVVMNRQAASAWMNMSQTADPMIWWATNGPNYIDAWLSWIMNEGNQRLDIYAGYEWPYADMGTKMRMSVLGNGDIKLEIGHLSWGYEILMTRWLTEKQLCNHEPYYEDASLSVTYYQDYANFTFDAVCQYSLRAVKANESTMNDGAWVWEPQLIDYVSSAASGHPSTFDPWSDKTYQSWNAGDPFFRQEVGYDSGVQYFNLTSEQTFIIELPQGSDVLGYLAQPPVTLHPIRDIIVPPIGSGFDRYPRGDGTNYDYNGYWPIMYNGTMSLGWVGNWTGNPDLRTRYDPAANTITMVGPLNFDNTHHDDGTLYHGAPWIEFNVTEATGDVDPPMAAAIADPNPADSGLLVALNGSLSTDNIGIVDYNWTFVYDGVEHSLHGQVVEFVFVTPGTYNITLNCTDAAGNYDIVTIELVVNPLIPEFSSVVIIATGLIAVIVVVSRFRRWKIGRTRP